MILRVHIKKSSKFRPGNSGTKKYMKSNFFRPYSQNQSHLFTVKTQTPQILVLGKLSDAESGLCDQMTKLLVFNMFLKTRLT